MQVFIPINKIWASGSLSALSGIWLGCRIRACCSSSIKGQHDVVVLGGLKRHLGSFASLLSLDAPSTALTLESAIDCQRCTLHSLLICCNCMQLHLSIPDSTGKDPHYEVCTLWPQAHPQPQQHCQSSCPSVCNGHLQVSETEMGING